MSNNLNKSYFRADGLNAYPTAVKDLPSLFIYLILQNCFFNSAIMTFIFLVIIYSDQQNFSAVIF